jgi:tRNA-specific 2-thiouridylase
LGIKLHSANFAAEYWDGVFEHFLAEYQSGRTPNPDILCNREIKFRAFLDYATELGADFIATGHYVRRDDSGERTALLKGLDPDKDQSYFLHQVGHRELSRSLFPVGDLAKPEVRKIAEQAGLTTARKKDSTGICFIGERRFKDFLQQYLPAQPGVIEDINGQALGEHQGLMYHTIGQRQGLGIGGLADRNAAPWYVVEKHVERNVLIVAQGNDHPRLYKHSLHASTLFWISEQAPAFPLQCTAKVRYRQPDQNCVVTKTASGFLVEFDVPQRAITPGQSVVFYHNDTCMGGGIIEGAL